MVGEFQLTVTLLTPPAALALVTGSGWTAAALAVVGTANTVAMEAAAVTAARPTRFLDWIMMLFSSLARGWLRCPDSRERDAGLP